MSRKLPDIVYPYWVEGYYGPGGPQGKHPELEGTLALATVHKDEGSQNLEIMIFQGRKDIGRIEYGRNPPIMLL